MHVAITDEGPVAELNTELDRALRLTHELVLVEFQQMIEPYNPGNRGFPNTDRADFIGLHDCDVDFAVDRAGERGCGHPTSGAPTQDNDVSHNSLVHTRVSSTKPRPHVESTDRGGGR